MHQHPAPVAAVLRIRRHVDLMHVASALCLHSSRRPSTTR